MKEDIFKCDSGYFGDVARNVLFAKIKIDDALQRAKPTPNPNLTPDPQPQPPTPDLPLPPADCSLLSALQARLGELNSDIDHLLREGILTLYMDLCELRERSGRMKAGKPIEGLLRSITEIVAGLLKPFFIYQEYHRCRTTPAQRKKNILSLRNLSTTTKRALPELDQKLHGEV